MELQQIVERIAEGLVQVDTSSKYIGSNARTGTAYLPGVPAMSEVQFTRELREWWISQWRSDFSPQLAIEVERSYGSRRNEKCDLVMSTNGSWPDWPEWAIELKRIQFVGDNGKNNDYGLPKAISPYLKDRSLVHDVLRLRDPKIALRTAVIAYGFEFSFVTCDEALIKHPGEKLRIDNILKVCRTNDPTSGIYDFQPMIRMLDQYLRSEGLVKNFCAVKFNNAWRHPCGGSGRVFGWEVEMSASAEK